MIGKVNFHPVGFSLVALVLLLCGILPGQGQNRSLAVKEGTSVVLRFAPEFLGFQRVSGHTLRTSYLANVSKTADGTLAINGNAQWQDANWPFLRNMKLAKVDKQRDFVEVELRDAGQNFKVRFDNSVGDLDSAFRQLAFIGTLDQFVASEDYRVATGRLLSNTFTGPLASIPYDKQVAMVKDLGYSVRAISGETYQRKFYLGLSFAAPFYDYNLYNRITARSARMKEIAHATATSFLLEGYPKIHGIKWHVQIRYGHQYELTGYRESASELMTVYVPFDLARSYAADEITEQQFVSKLKPVVDGNPVKITVPATFGFPYFLGPKGGCYKINTNGNKQYVDASYCN